MEGAFDDDQKQRNASSAAAAAAAEERWRRREEAAAAAARLWRTRRAWRSCGGARAGHPDAQVMCRPVYDVCDSDDDIRYAPHRPALRPARRHLRLQLLPRRLHDS